MSSEAGVHVQCDDIASLSPETKRRKAAGVRRIVIPGRPWQIGATLGLHSGATPDVPGVQKSLILRGFLEAVLIWRRGRDSHPSFADLPLIRSSRRHTETGSTGEPLSAAAHLSVAGATAIARLGATSCTGVVLSSVGPRGSLLKKWQKCSFLLRFTSWSGRRESNPRMQLGKLPFYH